VALIKKFQALFSVAAKLIGATIFVKKKRTQRVIFMGYHTRQMFSHSNNKDMSNLLNLNFNILVS